MDAQAPPASCSRLGGFFVYAGPVKQPAPRETRKPRQEAPIERLTAQDREGQRIRAILRAGDRAAAAYEATLDPRDRPLWAEGAAPREENSQVPLDRPA